MDTVGQNAAACSKFTLYASVKLVTISTNDIVIDEDVNWMIKS